MMDERIPQVLLQSFTYKDLTGIDTWETWTPTYSFTTATSLTVSGRYKIVGKQCYFQVKSTGTSLATTAGTDYIALPITAAGYGGLGVMTNDTANTAVGVGHIDVTNSRFYPPAQIASANDFIFAGWYEV
jgi:hypothetical protein